MNNIQELEKEAEKLLLDIGDRYGKLTKNEDGSFDMVTYGGAKMHYENAMMGCMDWRDYVEIVISDCPDAYEPEQIDMLNQILKCYIPYLLSESNSRNLLLAEDDTESYLWFPDITNQDEILKILAPIKVVTTVTTVFYNLNGYYAGDQENYSRWSYALTHKTGVFRRSGFLYNDENIVSLTNSGYIVLIRRPYDLKIK